MSTTQPPIACRSPRPAEWIRIKPGPEGLLNTAVLRHPYSGELYLVSGHLWPRLVDRLAMVCPRLCVNHHGEMFVWPIPTPTIGGGATPWRETAGVLASLAEMRWCRITANEAVGQYDVYTLEGDDSPTPDWPEGDFLDVLQVAFEGRIITSEDHPLVSNWN